MSYLDFASKYTPINIQVLIIELGFRFQHFLKKILSALIISYFSKFIAETIFKEIKSIKNSQNYRTTKLKKNKKIKQCIGCKYLNNNIIFKKLTLNLNKIGSSIKYLQPKFFQI